MRLTASIARAQLTGRLGIVLAVRDRDGRVGWGEASPLPGYSPDDLEMAEGALHLACGEIRARELELDGRAAVAALSGHAALARSPSARFALETALLDLLGQRSGRSIAECIGGERPYAAVGRNALLHAGDPTARLIEAAAAIVGRGIEAIKVKIGRSSFGDELRSLEALRRALPPGFELRLDANGAYGVEEARGRLAELGPLDVRFVEQPTTPERLADLGPCGVPWAADESLRLNGMAERLLGDDACAVFVLKPQVLGLLGAYELGSRALARGREVVVTHTFDGPVATAAACELALAFPRRPLACGLDPHDPAAMPIPHLATAGKVIASGRAGLGVAWSAGG